MRKGTIDIIKYTDYSHEICYGQTVLYQDKLYFVYDARVKKRLKLIPNKFRELSVCDKAELIEVDYKDIEFIVIKDAFDFVIPIEYSLHERAFKDKGQNILFDTQILHPLSQDSSYSGSFAGYTLTVTKYRIDKSRKTIQNLIKELEREVV